MVRRNSRSHGGHPILTLKERWFIRKECLCQLHFCQYWTTKNYPPGYTDNNAHLANQKGLLEVCGESQRPTVLNQLSSASCMMDPCMVGILGEILCGKVSAPLASGSNKIVPQSLLPMCSHLKDTKQCCRAESLGCTGSFCVVQSTLEAP